MINAQMVRNRCGEALAGRGKVEVDMVAGIPDSGTGHASFAGSNIWDLL